MNYEWHPKQLQLLALLLWLVAACDQRPSALPAGSEVPRFVGRAACARCHVKENDLWRGSDHDLSMSLAAPATVLGDFNNARFAYNGVTSTFYKDNERFLVRTEGADGKLAEFEILYTFGHRPLQQYLIGFPDGRLQALGIAWDARPDSSGGQRWFHLYPDDNIAAGDFLHWTQPAQNWNHMCADCHSTNLQKNYDAAANRFATSWSEINVACEACHGPGSRHVAWAERREEHYEATGTYDSSVEAPDRGLLVQLSDTDGGSWALSDSSVIATRVPPRTSRPELETCAPCHARRLTVSQPQAGDAFLENHRLALLTNELYYPDGQIRDEVFVYGSFLQSRMFHAGVTCNDCHDPHSLSVGFSADMACYKCHLPNKFASPDHHFHKTGSTGAGCVGCHMPETTYMVVDPRRDHSIRNPRPDLTLSLGIPNACSTCHSDKSHQWAMDAYRRWYGEPDKAAVFAAEAMAAAFADSAYAEAMLLAVIQDQERPAIVRASALLELGNHMTAQSVPTLRHVLGDPDPLLRFAAAQASHGIPVQSRLPFLVPLLVDPVRLIRAEAASRLAGSDLSALPPEAQRLFEDALLEYTNMQQFNADRAESHLNLGVLALQLGDAAAAEQSYRNALQLSPDFAPVYVNLADLYRQLDREADCAAILERAEELEPDNADVQHALGLQRIRTQRTAEALTHLQAAATLDPDNVRYAYVWGVALHSLDQVERGLDVLRQSHRRHPSDVDVLAALASFENESGNQTAALEYVHKLQKLAPGDPGVEDLLQSIQANGTPGERGESR